MEEWNEAHINMKEGILRETGRTHRQYLRAQKKHEYKRLQKADQYKGFHGNLDDLDESGDALSQEFDMLEPKGVDSHTAPSSGNGRQ